MAEGQMRRLKGSICNVPIDTLPQSADSNGIVMSKLKYMFTLKRFHQKKLNSSAIFKTQ